MLERLSVEERLVEILLDTADVQEAMKSPGQNRGRLYAQRAKQVDVEHRLERVTRQAEEALAVMEEDDDVEAESLVDRISRAHTAVASMKDVVLKATGRSIAAGMYAEGAEWRRGVRRDDRARRACPRSRLEVGRVGASAVVDHLYVVADSQPNSEDDGNEAGADHRADLQEEECGDDDDDEDEAADGDGFW